MDKPAVFRMGWNNGKWEAKLEKNAIFAEKFALSV